ncbi:CPBP family intramembrane glutamic endopeptidase [Brevibacillus daliensis]|uniref:CPBP family intramembrane glutamic endopeptidase n=1 Tax=Brevibacillus daliensis TaxID=2892995 RepID=UPI001E293832|nr:CPBP family intramembrane glutamic endopeptidase [Brevibacillus daliensis]
MKITPEQLDDRTLLLNLWLSQAILLGIAVVSTFFIYSNDELLQLFTSIDSRGLLYAALFVGFIVSLNLIMDKTLPADWLDDGGLNERLFRSQSLPMIMLICIVVGISEEWLFRGVIQHFMGNFWTSVIFTLIHIRYLKKILLVLVVFGTSYLLGLLFIHTQSLGIVMLAHAVVDFLLALALKYLHKPINQDSIR